MKISMKGFVSTSGMRNVFGWSHPPNVKIHSPLSIELSDKNKDALAVTIKEETTIISRTEMIEALKALEKAHKPDSEDKKEG